MSEKLVIPSFKSESEEADWWFDNRDVLAEQVEQVLVETLVEQAFVAEQSRPVR